MEMIIDHEIGGNNVWAQGAITYKCILILHVFQSQHYLFSWGFRHWNVSGISSYFVQILACWDYAFSGFWLNKLWLSDSNHHHL